jgi:hypothetical protein
VITALKNINAFEIAPSFETSNITTFPGQSGETFFDNQLNFPGQLPGSFPASAPITGRALRVASRKIESTP